MAWWVYKCNSRQPDYARASGDWREFFDGKHGDRWGSTQWTPEIEVVKRDDIIIAYQTDRNELVGVARVRQSCNRDTYLHLKPVLRIGVKVRPLKESDPEIAAIPALQGGPIQTVYRIDEPDAARLLAAAGAPKKIVARLRRTASASEEEAFIEGETRAAKSTLRNAALRAAAKEKWGLKCYCCGFDFEQFYGTMAVATAIVHHLRPFKAEGKRRRATVRDVRVVCANCHYVLHLVRLPVDVEDLKKTISKSWSRWSEDGVGRKG